MKEEYKIFEINSRSIWEVSNFGNVRYNGIVKEYLCDVKGYYRLSSGYQLHRAVAELFIPNPENKPCVDHIDGNTHNNKVTNLRWVTYSENNLNPNWIKKQKESQQGKKQNKTYIMTEDHKRKISEARKGLKHSEKFCKEQSIRMKGTNNPMYGKRKIWNEDHTEYKYIKVA